MLGMLLNRAVLSRLPNNHHEFDACFQDGTFPFGLNPDFLLSATYGQYASFQPEDRPPQNRFYRKLVDDVLKSAGKQKFAELSDRQAWMIRAAHACCYERSPAFVHVVQNISDPWFAKRLVDTRIQLLPERAAEWAERNARMAHYSRLQECIAAPLDLFGADNLDLLKQMTPDDWHQIVLSWNWDNGVRELDWITSQPNCDRATAAVAFFRADPVHYVMNRPSTKRHPDPAWDYEGFAYAVAERLERGFYTTAEFTPHRDKNEARGNQRALDEVRAAGRSPWQVPADLIAQTAVRAHVPKYDVLEGKFHYHYEYWLKNLAP